MKNRDQKIKSMSDDIPQSTALILRKVNTKHFPKTKYLQENLHLHPELLQYLVEMTNNMHWLYHSFILYTGSYMFRQ
jgi:hypothetical protein